jgi:indolepyruvate ferredoxin oxidoreductase beta subunit
VTEFLKPGIEEMCSILPPWLATRILSLAERRGWIDRVHWAMEVNTASVSGFLRFWLLAKLRGWRPRSYRYEQEQHAIEGWLALIVEAARLSVDLALEIAECARLIKGYGDTHKRGTGNYRLIEARIIQPVLAGRIPLRQGIDAVASARAAALVDPEGEALTHCLDELDRHKSMSIAAE